MLRFKIDVIETLKEAGYSTYRVRKEKILSENALQFIRNGKVPSLDAIEKLCKILDMQPGNIIKYVPDEDE